MLRSTSFLIPLTVVIAALFTPQSAYGQNTTKHQPWSEQLEKEEERLRLEVERLNQEFQREKVERERDEQYRQGQEHLRKTYLDRSPAARP
jgi:hypothetical protein